MEYVSGRDLAAILRTEGSLSEARVAEIGTQILLSLAEAHDAGIVHRDIKPANVMLLRTRDERDFAKLLDFGIAKLKVAGSKAGNITAIGDFVGTPEYLSPEQARGEELDPRSDLYSLGALLYELCGGAPLFVGTTPLAVVSQHLTQPPVPLGQRVACSSEFEAC
jgi:serine/threonine-protein kinase